LNALATLGDTSNDVSASACGSDPQDQMQISLPSETVSIKQALARVIPEVESALIKRALELTGNNRTRAAKILEISHRSLLYKLKSYNCG